MPPKYVYFRVILYFSVIQCQKKIQTNYIRLLVALTDSTQWRPCRVSVAGEAKPVPDLLRWLGTCRLDLLSPAHVKGEHALSKSYRSEGRFQTLRGKGQAACNGHCGKGSQEKKTSLKSIGLEGLGTPWGLVTALTPAVLTQAVWWSELQKDPQEALTLLSGGKGNTT